MGVSEIAMDVAVGAARECGFHGVELVLGEYWHRHTEGQEEKVMNWIERLALPFSGS
jgi:hypothetical protein